MMASHIYNCNNTLLVPCCFTRLVEYISYTTLYFAQVLVSLQLHTLHFSMSLSQFPQNYTYFFPRANGHFNWNVVQCWRTCWASLVTCVSLFPRMLSSVIQLTIRKKDPWTSRSGYHRLLNAWLQLFCWFSNLTVALSSYSDTVKLFVLTIPNIDRANAVYRNCGY